MLKVEERDGGTMWVSSNDKPDTSYCCGIFEQQLMKDLPQGEEGAGFTFNVIAGGMYGGNSGNVEVGSLQAKPENCGATFQVASNFNCLEFTSSWDSATHGITRYIHDHTQGPAASISAAPATTYRNYFLKHTPKDSTQEFTGQLQQQINILDNYPKIRMHNGYIEFKNGDNSPENDPYWKTFDFSDNSLVKVGSHRNVQVTYGHKQGGRLVVQQDPNQRVHQVFTAAMSCPARHGVEAKIAQWVVRAAYEGTIRTAIRNRELHPELPGSKKLFLSLVGGGVFCNPKEWIVDTLYELRPLLERSGLDVYLVVFRRMEISGENQQRVFELVESTGGTREGFELINTTGPQF
eukprot:TRINITY_DN59361_c0_g1_i1.p1 TRINITY_DN59361_c0_g1~~TRINITY_DN59361_c0_g1_i1.p1  ORF type:complete len:396 (-),score=40.70 TRINITY_DN59361_c0_g1_i1:35-1084(-)